MLSEENQPQQGDDSPAPPGSTRFTSDTARAAVQKRWDRERATKEARGSGTGQDARQGVDGGLAEPLVWLRGIAGDKKAADSARVAAARAVAELEGRSRAERPRTVIQLEAMTRPQRRALLAQLEIAHRLPNPEESAPTDG